MIIDKIIKVKIGNSKQIGAIRKRGFDGKMNIGDIIDLPIEYLSLNSHVKVRVKCDNCKSIKTIIYQSYNNTTKNNSEPYFCKKTECVNKKRILNNKNKYGVGNVFELNEIKNKIKKTNLERYGVENPQQNIAIQDKTCKTNMEKYGVDNVFKSKIIKDKIKKTNLERYGVEYPQQSPKIRSKYRSLHKSSKKELELLNYIKSVYDGEILKNNMNIISGYELDIYLPDLNLAFEFNGLYWHNELYKDKKYHLIKTEICEEKGIQLMHIWEDDWDIKQDIVKSMILNKLKRNKSKIFGRKCEIRNVDSKNSKLFMIQNHLQGNVNGSVRIGLYYDNELVSLMTFGKSRKIMNQKSIEGVYELLRFCNKLNTTVIGGASKLFKYFTKTIIFDKIITYADRSHSNGRLYEILGFTYQSKTAPNYHYIIQNIRKHRFGFRKDILVKQGFDPNMTEHSIMLERKIYRIYNSGNLKYIY